MRRSPTVGASAVGVGSDADPESPTPMRWLGAAAFAAARRTFGSSDPRDGRVSRPDSGNVKTFCRSVIDWAWTRPPASQPRSQHSDLGILVGRPVAMLDQPADVTQASQRPPRADEAQVDIAAVAGDDVAEVFRVSEREGGEVEQRVAPAALRPVDDAGHLVTGHKDVVNLQIAVNENRIPRTENGLSKSAVACDHVGVKNVMCDEPFALAVQARCKLVEVPTAPGWQWRVMQRPEGGTRRAQAAEDAVDGSPRWPSFVPSAAASASTGGLCQRICGVGTGAIAITSTSTSMRDWSASIFRNTSPTRTVARWLWATTTSTSCTSPSSWALTAGGT